MLLHQQQTKRFSKLIKTLTCTNSIKKLPTFFFCGFEVLFYQGSCKAFQVVVFNIVYQAGNVVKLCLATLKAKNLKIRNLIVDSFSSLN